MSRRAPRKRRSRVPVAALGLLIILAAAALMLLPGPQVRRESGLNVLLITVDTLRADAISAYGREMKRAAITPWMDRLAAEGVRFDEAHAHNVVTLPSHANILSGLYPIDHGVRDNSGYRFPPEQDTLATLLKKRGYRTGAFVSAFPLDSRFGLDRGFEVYEDGFADSSPRPAFLVQERSASRTVALAARWVAEQREQGEKPWFCWVHLYEPHSPYEPPEPFAARFRDQPYEGEVATVDAALTPLLAPILRSGGGGRTLVALTSDHGESLGEHGETTHGIFAYEATLRVPLILHQPRLFRPRVVKEPARHVDLLPTILDALSLPLPGNLRGRSLLPLAAGETSSREPDDSIYFEALSGSLNRGWAPLRGVIGEGTKFIDLPIPEIYDLRRDPEETRNLADDDRERLEGLRKRLALFRESEREIDREEESDETRERLRSLGYLTGRAAAEGAPTTEDDDPKRLIELDALLQEVVGLYAAGDLPNALARCRELVSRRPQMPVSWLHLAHLERESGNLTAAVEALEKAFALNPGDMEALSLLGAYLTQAGRPREASDRLGPYTEIEAADLQVLIASGLALARQERFPEALEMLEKAREQDPSSAALWVETGTVAMMASDPESARRAFESALAQNPEVARAHLSLGVLALEGGRPDDAASHWRQAVLFDPREFENLLRLGLFHQSQGHTSLARAYLQFFADSAPPAPYGSEIERVRMWLAEPVR